MSTPSIALIPSAYKALKVYSVLPFDGGGDFTFARTGTATRVNPQGLIETVATGVPRIDHLNNCPSLLLEPASTNILQRSDDFNNAYWTKNVAPNITSDFGVSPTGELNADKFTTIANNSGVFVSATTAAVGTETYTFSVFTKYGSGDGNIKIGLGGAAYVTDQYAQFDLSDGSLVAVASGATAGLEDYGNGWYRLYITKQVTTTGSVSVIIYSNSSNNSVFLAWGAQLEELNYNTSYIPTTTSSVTRNDESCNTSGNSSLISSSAGVLYGELEALFDDETLSRRISLSDGTATNRVLIFYDTTLNTFRASLDVGGVNQVNISFNIGDQKDKMKFAFKYSLNDFALWVDGVEVGTDVSGSVFMAGTLDDLSFDSGGANKFYGRCYDLRVYNTALTDTELQTLTS